MGDRTAERLVEAASKEAPGTIEAENGGNALYTIEILKNSEHLAPE